MPPITPADGPVAVTGATGYIGAHVVLNLVDHGYNVRACVRDATNPLKVAHLLAMNRHGARGSVSLHTADLMTPGQYDGVFAGCSCVFHVAAVLERDHAGGVAGSGNITPRGVYDGGVEATKNVLDSVIKSGSVKRMIYTSSTAAVMGGKPESHQYTEADWSDGGDLSGPKKELPYAYARSKCDTERLAYSTAAANGTFDVISYNPCHVLGPLMCKAHHEIWQYRIAGLLQGDALEPMKYNIIDTRDIAECARLSAESAIAQNGTRYNMVSTRGTGELHIREIQAILQTMYPEVAVAGEKSNRKSHGPKADTALSRHELGMEFHSIEDTLRATVDSAIELGFIKPAGRVTHRLMRWHDRFQSVLPQPSKL